MHRCIICQAEAHFCVKGTANWYCKDHAEEYFADLSYLSTIEEQVNALHQTISERAKELNIDTDTLEQENTSEEE